MSCISEDADVSSAGRRCHHSAPELGHTWESEEKSGTRAAWVGGVTGDTSAWFIVSECQPLQREPKEFGAQPKS